MAFCEKCGSIMSEEQTFCTACGARVQEENNSPQEMNSELAFEQQPIVAVKKKKKKGLAIALIIIACVVVLAVAGFLVYKFAFSLTPKETVDAAVADWMSETAEKSEKLFNVESLSNDYQLSLHLDDVIVPGSEAESQMAFALISTLKLNIGVDVNPDENQYLIGLSASMSGSELIKEVATISEEGIGLYNAEQGKYVIVSWEELGIDKEMLDSLESTVLPSDKISSLATAFSESFALLTSDENIVLEKDVDVALKNGQNISCDMYTVTPSKEQWEAFLNGIVDAIDARKFIKSIVMPYSFYNEAYDFVSEAAEKLVEENVSFKLGLIGKDIMAFELSFEEGQISFERTEGYYNLTLDAIDSVLSVEGVEESDEIGTVTFSYDPGYNSPIVLIADYDLSSDDNPNDSKVYGTITFTVITEDIDGVKLIFSAAKKDGGGSEYVISVQNLITDEVIINDASLVITTTDEKTKVEWPTIEPEMGTAEDLEEVFKMGLSDMLMGLINGI